MHFRTLYTGSSVLPTAITSVLYLLYIINKYERLRTIFHLKLERVVFKNINYNLIIFNPNFSDQKIYNFSYKSL